MPPRAWSPSLPKAAGSGTLSEYVRTCTSVIFDPLGNGLGFGGVVCAGTVGEGLSHSGTVKSQEAGDLMSVVGASFSFASTDHGTGFCSRTW